MLAFAASIICGMTTQAPITQNSYIQPTTTNQVQQVNAQDASYWNGDYSDFAKKSVLKHQIEQVIAQNETSGVTTSVSLMDMDEGNYLVTHNQDTEHFAASINKLAVALLLLEDLRDRKVSLDQPMTWLPSDVRAGFGVYDQPGAPLQASLRDVVYDMLNHSGNTAVRIVVNGVLGGGAAVNDRLAAKPQLVHTRLIPLDANRFFLGNTTSKESLWILQKMMNRQDRYARFMKEAMATNIFGDFGVRSQLAGNTYIVLTNKVGILDDVDGNNRHDVGIIYNNRTHESVGFSMLTTTAFDNAAGTAQANQSLMDMGKALLAFAGDKAPKPHKHYGDRHTEHRMKY